MDNYQHISADFPFESKFIEVMGSKMHYVDEGVGDPIVFIHGIPTSCYLWRNIIPSLTKDMRCIAVDLIGCGLSDKPDISYTIEQHIAYFSGFMQALNLDKVTYCVHGWGSIIGLDYAMKNEVQVKGLVFLESHIRSTETWDMVALPVQQIVSNINDKEAAYKNIIQTDYFMNEIFRAGSMRLLSETELAHYAKPFSTPKSRELLWQYIQEIPTGKKETAVTEIIRAYSQALEKSPLPKLMLYAIPGFLTTIETVVWAKQHLANLTLVEIGEGLHYLPESNPYVIAKEILQWFQQFLLR